MKLDLRSFVIGLGVVLFGIAGLLLWRGCANGPVFMLAFFGLALSLGTLIEGRYKPLRREHPGADWVETGERFIDPETGRLVVVFEQRRTGERQYRAVE